MERWLPGITALLMLVVLFLAFETHRQWVLILLLLFIIFYGLFANPMKRIIPSRKGKQNKKGKRK